MEGYYGREGEGCGVAEADFREAAHGYVCVCGEEAGGASAEDYGEIWG